MVIRAADKNGFSNTANVIDQITEMKENTLVVENDPPEVSFDTSNHRQSKIMEKRYIGTTQAIAYFL